MSDVERFVADLKSNADIQAAVAAAGGGLQAIVDVAKAKGYAITLDEARTYIREKASHLSDDQLDAIAGGKGSSHPAPKLPDVTQVKNIQTAVNISTAVQVAEVYTGAVAAVEGAVAGVVVAVGAIVFT